MARSFIINAQLQVKGPTNIKPVVASIRNQLKGIKANIQIGITPQTTAQVKSLNKNLGTINTSLKSISQNGANAVAVINALGRAIHGSAGNFDIFAQNMKTASQGLNTINNAAKQSQKGLDNFGAQIGIAAKRFLAFTAAASTVVSFTFAVRDAVQQSLQFERELIKLEQVGGDSKTTIQGIANEITRLSTNLGVSSDVLVKASVTLRQAGLTANETKTILSALAKTELSPSFENIGKTTEGIIAIMSQFGIKAGGVEKVLSAINTVSADYAVESSDLIEAVKRGGATFKAAGASLEEFLAVFTSIRSVTRESAETIATGLRTIVANLQDQKVNDQLKQLGINLRFTAGEAKAAGKDIEGQFVGPLEAARRLNAALQQISTTDALFAQVANAIGGKRQLAKAIPLIQQVALADEVYNKALQSQDSLTKNAIQAQQALLIQLDKLRESFLELFRTLGSNSVLRAFIDQAIGLAKAMTQLAKSLEPVVGALTVLGTLKLGASIPGFLKNFGAGFRNPKLATGGVVPGVGSGDTVPAMLTPGEFVIKKTSAQSIGYENLAQINARGYNRGGKVQKFGDGGIVRIPAKKGGFGLFTFADRSVNSDEDITVPVTHTSFGPEAKKAIRNKYPNADYVRIKAYVRGLQTNKIDGVKKQFQHSITKTIGSISNQFVADPPKFSGDNVDSKAYNDIYNKVIGPRGVGGIFEGALQSIVARNKPNFNIESEFQNFDFSPADTKGLSDLFDESGIYADAKLSVNRRALVNLAGKASRQFGTQGRQLNSKGPPITEAGDTPTKLVEKAQKQGRRKAAGGHVDSVPAMLTPGEFVINKDAARSFGYGNLHRVNKYAKGGKVQKFATGGVANAISGGFDVSSVIAGLKGAGASIISTLGLVKFAFSDLLRSVQLASGRMTGFGGAIAKTISSFSPGGIAAIGGVTALALGPQLGDAEKPGFFGRAGAAIGSAASAGLTVGGAAALATSGNPLQPYIAIGAGVLAAGVALKSFADDVNKIDISAIAENFQSSLDSGNNAKLAQSLQEARARVTPEKPIDPKSFAGQVQNQSITGAIAKLLGFGKQPTQADIDKQLNDIIPTTNILDQLNKLLRDAGSGGFKGLNKPGSQFSVLFDELSKRAPQTALALQKQIDIQGKLKQFVEQTNFEFAKLVLNVEDFASRVELASSIFDRDIGSIRSTNTALEGVVSGTGRTNLGAAGPLGAQLEGFSRTGGGFDQLKKIVSEQLLPEIAKTPLDDPQALKTRIRNNPSLANLGGAFIDNISDLLAEQFSGEKGQEARAKLQGGDISPITSALEPFERSIKDAADRAGKALNGAFELFEKDLRDIGVRKVKLNQVLSELSQAVIKDNIDSFIEDIQFNTNLSPSQRATAAADAGLRGANASFNAGQQVLRAGNNPFEIGQRITQLLENLRINEGNQRFAEVNGDIRTQQALKVEAVDISSEIQNLRQGLSNLANSTDLVQAAQNKLALSSDRLAQDEEARSDFAKNFAFGSNKDRIEQRRGVGLIDRALAQNGDISNFGERDRRSLQQALQLSRNARAFTDQGGNKVTGQDIEDLIGRKTRELLGIAAQDQGLVQNRERDKGVVEQIVQRQRQAGGVQAALEQNDIQDRIQTLDGTFNKFVNNLNQTLQQLQGQEFNRAFTDLANGMEAFVNPNNPMITALNNFPKTLEIKRDGRVEVIINGAEVLAKIRGDLGNFIVEEVTKQLADVNKKVNGLQ